MIHKSELQNDINELKMQIKDLERVLYSANIITTTEELGLHLYTSIGHYPTPYVVAAIAKRKVGE
jgi:hypothetical protein